MGSFKELFPKGLISYSKRESKNAVYWLALSKEFEGPLPFVWRIKVSLCTLQFFLDRKQQNIIIKRKKEKDIHF